MTDTDGLPVDTAVGLTFALYDAAEGGEALWAESQDAVPVAGGVLSTTLGNVESLDNVAFDRALWLEVTFDSNGKKGINGSRMRLDAVPFAMGMRGIRYIPGDSPSLSGGYAGNSVEDGAVGATISGGGADQFENRILAAGSFATIGGGSNNVATAERATIAGGRNHEAARLAFVGGGDGNKATGPGSAIVGGFSNKAEGEASFIGNGFQNMIMEAGISAVINGGQMNIASGAGTSIGGGNNNNASGPFSTIGGGDSNRAEGNRAAIPGGRLNVAGGEYSFAAGFKAEAEHKGTFVWADWTSNFDQPFVSTAPLQFLIRARNGVGIGTNSPQGALHVKSVSNDVPDIVLGGSDASNTDGLIRSDPEFSDSDILLHANGSVAIKLDVDNSDLNDSFTISDGDGQVVFEVHEGGTTVVASLSSFGEINGSALRAGSSLGEGKNPGPGPQYRDNVIYAWATVSASGVASSSFGCTVQRLSDGEYRITYLQALPNGVSVSVTPFTGANPVLASVKPGSNSTDVTTLVFEDGKFVLADAGFGIQVVGRP